jgi:hypothetical protein
MVRGRAPRGAVIRIDLRALSLPPLTYLGSITAGTSFVHASGIVELRSGVT